MIESPVNSGRFKDWGIWFAFLGVVVVFIFCEKWFECFVGVGWLAGWLTHSREIERGHFIWDLYSLLL